MRLEANETTIRVGETKITLRPSLRAAYKLLVGDGALLTLLDGISDFDTGIVSHIIRASATDEDEAEQFIAAMLHGPGSLASKAENTSHYLRSHVIALLAGHGRDDSAKPPKIEPEGKRITVAEYLEELFSIGTGWLHWTPETTWSATPAEILAAHAGHMKMLRLLYGSPSQPDSKEPHFERDEDAFAELKALALMGGNKVR